jgi:DNA-binding transcriptional regulator PaaX
MKGKPYGEITKQIFLILGVTSIVVVVAAAPGVVLALKLFEQNGRNFPKKSTPKSAARSLRDLRKNKFIEIKQKGGQFEIRLTKKGKERFKDIQLRDLKIEKPLKWDGKWRIVAFDIPEKSHRRARVILREKLKDWEFYPLQKSVWVCPWPCEDEIRFIAEMYEVGSYVDIAIADKILEDKLILQHFRLCL